MKLKNGILGLFARLTGASARSQHNSADASCQTDKKLLSPPPPPPPPYTTTDSTLLDQSLIKKKEFLVPPGATKWYRNAQDQLSRYIIEIIAIALDVNFDELNSSLYKRPIASNTNTILTNNERDNLLQLSRLVRKVLAKVQYTRSISTIPRGEMLQVDRLVSAPGKALGLHPGYAIQLVASYSEYAEDAALECDPRTNTVLAPWHWKDNPRTKFNMNQSMAMYANAIEELAYPEREAQHILGRALERYQHSHNADTTDVPNYLGDY